MVCLHVNWILTLIGWIVNHHRWVPMFLFLVTALYAEILSHYVFNNVQYPFQSENDPLLSSHRSSDQGNQVQHDNGTSGGQQNPDEQSALNRILQKASKSVVVSSLQQPNVHSNLRGVRDFSANMKDVIRFLDIQHVPGL